MTKVWYKSCVMICVMSLGFQKRKCLVDLPVCMRVTWYAAFTRMAPCSASAKYQEAEAKAIEGAGDIMFTGRKMGGLIDVTDEAIVNDDRRALWIGIALRHAQSLPPKS